MQPDHPLLTRYRDQHAQGTLPHAVLLTGADPSVLADMANALAFSVLGVDAKQQALLNSEGGHPDLQILSPEGALQILKIDAIRAVIEFTHQTPQQGHCQVIILQEADRLNTASANALLKSLEEPSGQVYWILTSSHPSRLLPTITSRCALGSLGTDLSHHWIDAIQQLEHAERYFELADSLANPMKQPFDPLERTTFCQALEFSWVVKLLQQMALDALKRGLDREAPVMFEKLFPKNQPSPWSLTRARTLLEAMQVQQARLELPVAQNSTLRWDGLFAECFEILSCQR